MQRRGRAVKRWRDEANRRRPNLTGEPGVDTREVDACGTEGQPSADFVYPSLRGLAPATTSRWIVNGDTTRWRTQNGGRAGEGLSVLILANTTETL